MVIDLAYAKRRESAWKRRGINITYTQYDKMLRSQHGRCALCRRVPKRALAVDHNHKTGKVRGLTCFRCNRFIIGRMTLPLARALVAYLERYDDAA